MLDNLRKAVKHTTGKIVNSQSQKRLWSLNRSNSSLRSDPFDVVTVAVAEFDQYWRHKIGNISCSDSLVAILKSLVIALSTSEEEVAFEKSPGSSLTRTFFRSPNAKFSRRTIFIQGWTLSSVVNLAQNELKNDCNESMRKFDSDVGLSGESQLVVFPRINATDRILNELIPVPFRAIFLKCKLLEFLMAKILALKKSEKSGMGSLRYQLSFASGGDDCKNSDLSLNSPSNRNESVTITNLLSIILKSCLIDPFSSHLITDAIANCLMMWDDTADIIDPMETLENLENRPDQLPPHILLAELIQIARKAWSSEGLNVVLQTLMTERDLDAYRFCLDESALSYVEDIVLDTTAANSPKNSNCGFVRQLSPSMELKSIEESYADKLQKLEQEHSRLMSAQQSINLSFIVKTVKDLCRQLTTQQNQTVTMLLNRWDAKLTAAYFNCCDENCVSIRSGSEDKEFTARLYAKAETRVQQRLDVVNQRKRDLAIQRGELKERELRLKEELEEVQSALTKLFDEEMLCAGEICLELERLDKIQSRNDMYLKEVEDKRRTHVTSLNDLKSIRALAPYSAEAKQFSKKASKLFECSLTSEEEEQHISQLFDNITENIAPKVISLEKEIVESCCEALERGSAATPSSCGATDEMKRERSPTLDSELFALNVPENSRDVHKPKLQQAAESCERTFDDITDASAVLTRLNIPVQYRTTNFGVKLGSSSPDNFDTPHTTASSPTLHDVQSPISFPVSKLVSEYKRCKAVFAANHDLVYDD